MQSIQSIPSDTAFGPTRRLFDNVKSEQGVVSNMLRTMAQSPDVVEGYLEFRRALEGGKLAPEIRERIALAVAQANHNEYSLAQHVWQGERAGLTEREIQQSRDGAATDPKAATALKFVRSLAMRDSDCTVEDLRTAGYSDAEIVEMIAQVALNEFENYFNMVVETDLDYPRAGMLTRAA
jgi:AhpD family alkylhydroperoxidase